MKWYCEVGDSSEMMKFISFYESCVPGTVAIAAADPLMQLLVDLFNQ